MTYEPHAGPDDAARYETAQSIQQANPDWLVMWGVYTHQYVAFPLFRAPEGCIVQSASPDELFQRMRDAELAFKPAQACLGRPAGLSRAMPHDDAVGWRGGEIRNL